MYEKTSKTEKVTQGTVVTGVPMFPDSGDTATARFTIQGWNDVWAIFVFLAVLVATVMVSGFYSASGRNEFWSKMDSDTSHSFARFVADLPFVVAAVFLLSFVSTICMTHFARGYILGSLILVIVINLVLAAFSFHQKHYLLGALWLLFAVLSFIFLLFSRHLIAFSAVLLKKAGQMSTEYIGVFFTLIGATIAFFMFGFIWFWGAIPPLVDLIKANQHKKPEEKAQAGFLLIFLMFALFYAVQVITNVVHVTCSGLTAIWYFVGDRFMPANPTSASAKRAMTYSFGSICLGSLIVAFLQTLIWIVRSAASEDGNDFARCCALCILEVLEALVEKFNVYAFTHIAIYGTKFTEAAGQTWGMIKEFGWTAYFNDALVWPCIVLTSLMITVITGLAVYFFERDVAVALASAVVAHALLLILLRPVYSSVVAQFVCIAEAQDIMRTSNPVYAAELYASLPIQNLI